MIDINVYIIGLKISEKGEKTNETISGICKAGLKESIEFEETFFSENTIMVNEDEDSASSSCNNCLVNYKSRNKIRLVFLNIQCSHAARCILTNH